MHSTPAGPRLVTSSHYFLLPPVGLEQINNRDETGRLKATALCTSYPTDVHKNIWAFTRRTRKDGSSVVYDDGGVGFDRLMFSLEQAA